MKKNLILSLGSNIEPRDKYLKRAIEILNRIFKLKLISSLYKTKPLDDKNQQDFFNICVNYETDIINPLKILHIVKDIEKKIGRKKNIKRPKGPRIIDIDIIFFDKIVINSNELTIPHIRMFNRKFVLVPLLEILPDDSAYIKKYNLIDCLDKIGDQKIENIGELAIG